MRCPFTMTTTLCTSTQHLDNKMEYSNQSKELVVVKNKITELNNEINHAIRNHKVVQQNKKRISLEIDRLDSILHTAQIELPYQFRLFIYPLSVLYCLSWVIFLLICDF